MRKIDRIFIHCFYNGGETEKNTFRFENTSLRFTIVEHIVLRIIIGSIVNYYMFFV